MKHITFLTLAASLSFSAFIITLAFGFISMPVFIISATTWISLLAVDSYTPKTRTWLPRTAKARLMAKAGTEKATWPLAA